MSEWSFPNLASIGVSVYGREYDGGTLATVVRCELWAALDHRGLLGRFRAAFKSHGPGEYVQDLPAHDAEITLARMLMGC